ncbi:MAG TPA: molybdopterin-dependent oxidoreductase [Capsulimonadaceae bacterium]|nr:molybdopterin-dependent oxidoreductase [Capsulimonadaceae bacterium]
MARRDEPNESEFPLLKDDSAPDVSEQAGASATSDATQNTSTSKPSESKRIARVSVADRLAEAAPEPITLPQTSLKLQTRRDFLLYGAGAVALIAGFWWLLPEDTQHRLGAHAAAPRPGKERFLDKSLKFDDDVAAALYSPNRLVPTYSKSQVTPNLINNYNGQTPDPGYLDDWNLTLVGLASGKIERVGIKSLLSRFAHHEQITRLVCVEGWSAITWWGGLLFSDLLQAYPPRPGARWARLDSSINLDSDGNPDPYYVSIDLPTAHHPQTLLATHHNGAPLTVDHGAPLRLVAPMKLGLKNIKAVTKITYTILEPADYWNERGYSKYDGL